MITKKEKVLVIAAIDGTTLSDALQKAADAGHQDHLLRPPDRRLAERRLLRDLRQFPGRRRAGARRSSTASASTKGKTGPFNIELFGGSADDNNAFFFYNGAMSVLQPLIDKGVLVVPSKQMGMDKVATLRWDAATAQSRMENLLSAYYTKKHVDAVLSPYDGLSIGIISALKGVGYGTSGTAFPIISGQDAEIPSVKSILAHEQYSTIFKDTRDLAKVGGEHGRRGAAGKTAGDQRHQDLQQQGQDRALLPAEAGAGDGGQREVGAGRHGLLQGRAASVRLLVS